MKSYVKCGYRITIEEDWKGISRVGEDPTIGRDPRPLRLDRKCDDKKQVLIAVDDYFREVT